MVYILRKPIIGCLLLKNREKFAFEGSDVCCLKIGKKFAVGSLPLRITSLFEIERDVVLL